MNVVIQRWDFFQSKSVLYGYLSSSYLLSSLPDNIYDRNRASGRLNNGIPMVPKRRVPSELEKFRCSLPVYEHQEDIIRFITENKVVLVVGETGSGKTTQVGLTNGTARWSKASKGLKQKFGHSAWSI